MLLRLLAVVCLLTSILPSCKTKVDSRDVTFYHRHSGAGIDPSINAYLDPSTRAILPKDTNILMLDEISSSRAMALTRREPDQSYCEIEIHENQWDRLSEVRRLALLYHEIGHCLGVEHVDRGNVIETIMYERLLEDVELRTLANAEGLNTDWITKHFLDLYRDRILQSTQLFCKFDQTC